MQFFPAQGYRIHGMNQLVDQAAYYWTSDKSTIDEGLAGMFSATKSSRSVSTTYLTDVFTAPIRPIVKGIKNSILIVDDEDETTDIFSIDGTKNSRVQKGVNIIRTKDGQTKKVFVK